MINDLEFFNAHPSRAHRLRPPFPGEVEEIAKATGTRVPVAPLMQTLAIVVRADRASETEANLNINKALVSADMLDLFTVGELSAQRIYERALGIAIAPRNPALAAVT
ncbi:hypothetical protein [Oricola indica]|uniref:hypothetical protein n=1 Tax=Oricola indica TaxID=2872591 RepID=UPI001CBE894A|nr:hypothetical protein [Oricola indica]